VPPFWASFLSSFLTPLASDFAIRALVVRATAAASFLLLSTFSKQQLLKVSLSKSSQLLFEILVVSELLIALVL
jgi:hypothetical protein